MRRALLLMLVLGCGDGAVVLAVQDPRRLAREANMIAVGSEAAREERSLIGLSFPVTMVLRGEPDSGGTLEVEARLDDEVLARGRGQIFFDSSIVGSTSIDLDFVCAGDEDCMNDVFCNGPRTCDRGFCVQGPPPCPRFDGECGSITCDEPLRTCIVEINPDC